MARALIAAAAEWERLCANVERHLAAWHGQTALVGSEVEEADEEPTDEERAAAARVAREAKRTAARARIRGCGVARADVGGSAARIGSVFRVSRVLGPRGGSVFRVSVFCLLC